MESKNSRAGGVRWLNPPIRLRLGSQVIIGLGCITLDALILSLSVLPACSTTRPPMAVCGFGASPVFVSLVGIPIVVVELLAALLLARRYGELRLGASPEGLVIRSRVRDRVVPWERIEVPSTASKGGFVRITARIQELRTTKPTRRIRVPAAMAGDIAAYREQFVQ
jgi:hypothetical protein